jgi:hypothetical protein
MEMKEDKKSSDGQLSVVLIKTRLQRAGHDVSLERCMVHCLWVRGCLPIYSA